MFSSLTWRDGHWRARLWEPISAAGSSLLTMLILMLMPMLLTMLLTILILMTKLVIITLALICNFWNLVVIGKYCAPLHWKPNQPNVKNRRMYNQSLNSVVLSYKMFLFEEETSCKHVWAAMWTLIISKWGKGLNLEAWYAQWTSQGLWHCVVKRLHYIALLRNSQVVITRLRRMLHHDAIL